MCPEKLCPIQGDTNNKLFPHKAGNNIIMQDRHPPGRYCRYAQRLPGKTTIASWLMAALVARGE